MLVYPLWEEETAALGEERRVTVIQCRIAQQISLSEVLGIICGLDHHVLLNSEKCMLFLERVRYSVHHFLAQ